MMNLQREVGESVAPNEQPTEDDLASFLEHDFVEVEDCAEDPFVLVDEEFDEKTEVETEDEDFVLTHVEEDESAEKEAIEADVVAVAKTKKLVFFLSLVVTTYVVAINTVAGFCMLAKSIHTLEFKKAKTPGSTTASLILIGNPQENSESEQAIMNRPRLNIPTLSSASTKVLQPARIMIPQPGRRLEPVVDADAHVMPSPTIVDAPLCSQLGISPPDIDASTYHGTSTAQHHQEPFPSTWPRPTPMPKRTYPSLAVISVVENAKAADVAVVGEIVQSPPKSRSFNLPAVGGNIPFSPSLHIPSVALDRVQSFWDWRRSEKETNDFEAKNETTSTFVPVPGSSDERTSTPKSALDQFIRSSGDHGVVLFYDSSSELYPSKKLISVWETLSDKVRHTFKIDCTLDSSLCNMYGNSRPFALMIKEGRLQQSVQLDYDPLHMFTNFIKALEDTTFSASSPTSASRAIPTLLSHYTFREFVAQNKHVAVMFGRLDGVGSEEHQPLWPILNSFAQGLEEQGLNAAVAFVDCHSNPTVCRDQSIVKFPTLRWFSNGEASVPDFEKQLVKKKFIRYARRVLAGIE